MAHPTGDLNEFLDALREFLGLGPLPGVKCSRGAREYWELHHPVQSNACVRVLLTSLSSGNRQSRYRTG